MKTYIQSTLKWIQWVIIVEDTERTRFRWRTDEVKPVYPPPFTFIEVLGIKKYILSNVKGVNLLWPGHNVGHSKNLIDVFFLLQLISLHIHDIYQYVLQFYSEEHKNNIQCIWTEPLLHDIFHNVSLMIITGSRNGLAPVWCQAIAWTNDDPVQQCHLASPKHN